MKTVTSILLAFGLAGCATTTPIVPDSLLTCAEQPASPADKPGLTQRDAALFIVDLAAAGADCRSKLGAVRRTLEPTK